jgi:hypothetical protein
MTIPEKPRLERADTVIHTNHGIHKDERGQDQPADKSWAQKVIRSDMSGLNAQRDSVIDQPAFPGQPAGGE